LGGQAKKMRSSFVLLPLPIKTVSSSDDAVFSIQTDKSSLMKDKTAFKI